MVTSSRIFRMSEPNSSTQSGQFQSSYAVREETSRLIFRDFAEADGEKVLQFFSEKESHPYILKKQQDPNHIAWCNAESAIYNKQTDYAQRDKLIFSVLEKSTGRMIGTCHLADAWQGAVAEVGWHLGIAYSGKGYGTEIAAELLRVGINQRRVKRIHADCFEANAAVINVLTKVGMRRLPLSFFRKWFLAQRYDENSPIARYAISRTDESAARYFSE